MNLLVVCPHLPYPSVPHAGGKFVWLALEFLSPRHTVDLVARVFPEEEERIPEVRAVVRNLFEVREPDSASPLRGGLLAKALSYRRLAAAADRAAARGGYDAVLVEFTETGFFLSLRGWPPAAIDTNDILAKPYSRLWQGARGIERYARRAFYSLIAATERRALRRFRIVFVRSPDDGRWAAEATGHPDLRVLYHPAGAGMRDAPRSEQPAKLLFVGALHRRFNVDAALYFLRRVFPAVRREFPDAVFHVVGANPPPELLRTAASEPALRVTGFVEDLSEEYLSATVFVAPILVGGGIIAKIQDAMALGIPVVTTPYGNEGIGAKEGEAILIARNDAEFAEKVCALLRDPALRARIGESARADAAARFAPDAVFGGLEAALVEIARKT